MDVVARGGEIPKKQQPSVPKAEEPLKTVQEKKKFRHRPEPLFIPPPPSYNPNPTASYLGATLYQSQLRSPRVLGDHLLLDPTHELPPYTPPPMLSPVRQGSGLFSNVLISGHGPGAHPQLPLTPLTPTPRVLLCRSSESPFSLLLGSGGLDSIDGSNVTVTPGPGEQTVDVEPRINIGLRFQAEIPELQDISALAQDTHKATLVWKPWPELENHDLQQRVENLLNLCCSSALPGGGTNSEFALHSLFEAKVMDDTSSVLITTCDLKVFKGRATSVALALLASVCVGSCPVWVCQDLGDSGQYLHVSQGDWLVHETRESHRRVAEVTGASGLVGSSCEQLHLGHSSPLLLPSVPNKYHLMCIMTFKRSESYVLEATPPPMDKLKFWIQIEASPFSPTEKTLVATCFTLYPEKNYSTFTHY
ncbi:hypothetical protein P7K49_007984 [Saguinus oedipus]|uniref:ELM2 domain-containing protein n=1 Tax=Saguinus oedipus TaxID=9490 RepID=A0ABQ9VWD8_SAGOE|nr:hypothetical protein P7K49_007984 [Saguinus oedipus]